MDTPDEAEYRGGKKKMKIKWKEIEKKKKSLLQNWL